MKGPLSQFVHHVAAALSLCVLLLTPTAFAGTTAKVQVGIMPTYTLGNLPTYGPGVVPGYGRMSLDFTSAFSHHLTMLIYQALDKSSVQPSLLNPGGLYSGVGDDWSLDFGKQNHSDVILTTVLLKIDVPKSGDMTLRIRSELWDVKQAKPITSWESSARVNTRDLANEDFRIQFGEGSRRFDKQPLGAAARKIAEDIQSQVTHATSSLPSSGDSQIAEPQPGSCQVDFKVNYVAKHSSSKSYDIVINGKDETMSIADGVLPFRAPSGPLLIQLAVHDPPYKMPKQDLYQANTQLDCSQAIHDLRLEIGPAGEGSLTWQ
jgi:hypothetical protein